jgi:hypothetical protein
MRIDGLFKVKKAGKRFARPGKIAVKIGAPVLFPSGSDPEWIARELEETVKRL